MSRNGKIPVVLPDKVKGSVEGTTVKVEGPKGKLEKTFDNSVEIVFEDNSFKVQPSSNSRHSRAMFGTTRSIINSMVKGVAEGFEKNLELSGTGYRCALKGKILDLSLGFSHNIEYPIPEGITVAVAENTKIKVTGADKHMVGQVAASIKLFSPAEPYKGKGVSIVGEHVRRKEGKKSSK